MLAATACSDRQNERSGNGRQEQSLRLPPSDEEALESIFAADFEKLGVRMARGGLLDAQTRKASDTGRHLALYVEPVEQWPNARYLETIMPLTKLLAPSAFERWPDLVSFDICQEPFGDPAEDPPPATAVELQRRAAHALDNAFDLLGLMVAARDDPGAIRVGVSEELGAEPSFKAILEAVTGTPPATEPAPAPAAERYGTPSG